MVMYDVAAQTPPPSSSSTATICDAILLQLQQLDEKIDSMDRKVQRTIAALG